MKTNTTAQRLTFMQGFKRFMQAAKRFMQKSPARMAFIIAVILYIATILISPASLNVNAIGSIIMLTLLLSFAAAGQTIVLIGGGMDFGVGAVMSSAAILTTTIMNSQDGHFFQLLVTALAMGALVGLINGLCTVKIGLPPLIVTMAISNVVTRMQYVLTQGSPMGYASPTFIKSVTSRLFGLQFLPSILLYALIIIPLVYFLLNRSRFGKQVYLVGNNPVAARLNGINVAKVQVLTYVFSGMFAAFAGMLGAAYMNAARCQIFDNYAYDSLIAVIIGGTLFSGGVGSYTGSIAGALVLTVLSNLLTAAGFTQPMRNLSMGLIMVALLILYNREKNVRQ